MTCTHEDFPCCGCDTVWEVAELSDDFDFGFYEDAEF